MRPGIDPKKFMNLAKIDLATGEMKILYSQPQASQSSALVTAGDLVFWGDANRRFRAFDADTGKVLWETIVGGMVMTSTITYAVNGKQYVAILTGDGQSVTAGPLGVTKGSMAPAVRGHNSVVVFALPEQR
jgi:alcohol dehydrogenase (cytochrome c)